jgi:hypothetical protein
MTQKEILKQLENIQNTYPDIDKIEITYYGAGDSFDSFNEYIAKKDELIIDDIDINHDIISSILWEALDHSEADFNNEGSEGTITIDLKNKQVTCENFYFIIETVPGGITTLIK